MEKPVHPVPLVDPPLRPRPVLLTVLSLFAFVYFGVFTLLFLAGFFMSDTLTEITNQYAGDEEITRSGILALCTVALVLHALALTGVILMWRMKRKGYYLTALASLAIAALQFLLPGLSVASTAVYISLIFLFGFFIRKFH